jgi:hypothetical protein
MKTLLVIGVLVVAAEVFPRAQDPLSAARDLYASAAYEEALSTLSGIAAASTASAVARQVDEYRAFCLYALGRTREAESVAEAIIRREPLGRLQAVDASPRIETMFMDVRRRLLPSMIREQFRIARSAIDRKSFTAAEAQLTDARLMIQEAEKLGIKDDGLGDLGVLVDGFLGLIQSASESRPAAGGASVATNARSEVGPRENAAAAPPADAGSAAPGPSAPASRATNAARAYTASDEGVTPPFTLQQRLPAMPQQLQTILRAVHAKGLLDVVIDETGRVADATIRQSLNPTYDPLVLRSAREWKYQPAVKDGVPVRFVKTITLIP